MKKKWREEQSVEEPELTKKYIEGEEELKERAEKMLKKAGKSMEKLKGSDQLKRRLKNREKQTRREQTQRSKNIKAPILFGK